MFGHKMNSEYRTITYLVKEVGSKQLKVQNQSQWLVFTIRRQCFVFCGIPAGSFKASYSCKAKRQKITVSNLLRHL